MAGLGIALRTLFALIVSEFSDDCDHHNFLKFNNPFDEAEFILM